MFWTGWRRLLFTLFIALRRYGNTHTELTTINTGVSIMAKSNLSQHEQLLKSLEKSIREISERQNAVDDTLHQAWALSNTVRNMTMQLFVMADDLRSTRLEFERQES